MFERNSDIPMRLYQEMKKQNHFQILGIIPKSQKQSQNMLIKRYFFRCWDSRFAVFPFCEHVWLCSWGEYQVGKSLTLIQSRFRMCYG